MTRPVSQDLEESSELLQSDRSSSLFALLRNGSSANGTGGANGDHVEGVRDMVINTQRRNLQKINSVLESNYNKVRTSSDI